MPTFPTCQKPVPPSLRLFKPSHYALLAYWVYFSPDTLRSYFYQALPDLYHPEKQIGFFRKWGTPAFRNLFLMIPFVCLFITVLIGIPATLLSAWTFHVPVEWAQWRDGGMLGVALGVTIGMAFGMVGRLTGGVALSTMIGVVYGTTVGVLGGISLSVALGISFTTMIDGALVVGAVFGVVGGTALTLDIDIGIALSLAFAVMAAMSFGAEFLASKVLGVRFGALQVRGVMSGAFVAGAFRLLFYPLEWLLAWGSVFRQKFHPLHWDELTILPVPWTKRLLGRKLRENEQEGLRFLANVARNLFRRAVVQAVLYRHLATHPTPLHFLYNLLSNPSMQEYLLIPVTPQQRVQHVSIRRVFLGELALRPIEATQHPRFRRSAWWLNLRRRKKTPVTQFAGMLYDLLDARRIEREPLELNTYREIYTSLSAYPDGAEIALSYDAMATFLSYQTVADLPSAVKVGSQLALSLFFQEAIRPTVLTTLTQLGHVGQDVALYYQDTTQQSKLAALARAAGDLNDLTTYVAEEVMAPEQYLLRRVIDQWQRLIIEAIGDIGKTEVSGASDAQM